MIIPNIVYQLPVPTSTRVFQNIRKFLKGTRKPVFFLLESNLTVSFRTGFEFPPTFFFGWSIFLKPNYGQNMFNAYLKKLNFKYGMVGTYLLGTH